MTRGITMQKRRGRGKTLLIWEAVVVLLGSSLDLAQQSVEDCNPALPRNATRLCKSEVRTLLERTAATLDLPMTVAVVDRVGNILGVLQKPNAPLTAPGNFARENDFFQGQEQ